MLDNPILYLLMRDLGACAVMTIVAMVIMAVVAVPITFMANNPDEVRALPKRLLANWFLGVAVTAGLWILLTAIGDILLLWLPGIGDLSIPALFAYSLCFIVGIRVMWRSANTPTGKQPRQFSLKTLLIAQLVILSLCGLWIAVRRSEIEWLYKLQRQQTRQAMP
jgi:hypothetical protein